MPLVLQSRLVLLHDGVRLDHAGAARNAPRHAHERIFVARRSVFLDRLPLVLQVDGVVAAVGGWSVHQAVVLNLQLLVRGGAALGHRLRLVGQQCFVEHGTVVGVDPLCLRHRAGVVG